MARRIEFHFDFPSPYSYLAHTQLPLLAERHGAVIDYRPFRILPLMKKVGNTPTTVECANKSKYAGADLQRWARRYGVPVRRGPNPRGTDFAALDRAALLAIDAGRGQDYVTAVFRGVWGDGLDLSHRAVVTRMLDAAGFDGAELLRRAAAPEVAQRLDAATDAAAERGIFGSPTFFVGEQMFFGNDRLDFVAEALAAA